ncbi:hypothetical protein [Psittacicella gerlachiana]|uniref:Uncharacterized protein n=1 Tax=Psittacicella gerlachiana TaxID=2028574 RepID=A0A3A1YQ13_9GAMM|nr:hypothetical protein [Psittacicella gerlachiana]RIY38424.1 hypothetical protein CKF59_01005 [Psittacicella gerlachiana]
MANTREMIPYAFIRFFNEDLTLEVSLKSIAQVIKRGVLVYHRPLPGVKTDNSLEIAKKFVATHPGFILVEYPYPVLPAGHSLYRQLSRIPLAWRLDTYYRYGLFWLQELAQQQQELERAWVVKIDADQVYSPSALEQLFQYIQTDPLQRLCYFMASVDVVYYQDEIYVKSGNMRYEHDHYVVKLSSMPPIEFHCEEKGEEFFAYERMPFVPKRGIYDSNDLLHYVTSFHFKANKILYRGGKVTESFSLYSGLSKLLDLENFLGTKEFYRKENALAIAKSLNWENNGTEFTLAQQDLQELSKHLS